jgi:predicted amidohydrolase YtcJ
MYFPPDELTAMTREFDARGPQVCIHAQEDRAIEAALDAYATAATGHPRNPLRHRIEHGGAMHPPLAALTAELGIIIVSKPGSTGSQRFLPAAATSCTRSRRGGGRGSPWPGPPTPR